MLVRLFGSNFRSFKGPFELSLVAADLKREEDRNRGVIEVPLEGLEEPLRLLRVAAIYGPNASGKSTVVAAAKALRWLVSESSARSKPGKAIPCCEPFLLADDSRTAPTHLGCDVVCGKSLVRYEIVFGAAAIRSESLSVLDATESSRLIERSEAGEVRGKLFARSPANRLYVKEMQPNVAVLSKLAQHGPRRGAESVRPYHDAIVHSLRCRDYSGTAAGKRSAAGALERFADDPAFREWVMQHLMRSADVGICDAEVRRESDESTASAGKRINRRAGAAMPVARNDVVHSFLHAGESVRAVDFSRESLGTRKLFRLASDWWSLAHEPVSLFADELSAGLHPRLLDRMIRAVNDAPAETVRSQLILTTHDTGLLEGYDGLPPALRRDQVYFTKKDVKGVSELYALAEFKEDARPVHNIRKRYLSGLYGAIPLVEDVSL